MSNSTVPIILLPIPQTVVGPLVIGSWINWLLMGTLIVQVYYYRTNYHRDRMPLRILVYTVLSIDIAQTVVTSHLAWFFAVANWNDSSVLAQGIWSAAMLPTFAGLISIMVQLFYSWRIWVLSKTKFMKGLAILISLISSSQGLTGIVASIVIQFDATQERLLQLHPEFQYWLAGSFTADILITFSMVFILYSAKSMSPLSRKSGLLDRLISNAIQTGFITAVCAGVDLALFVAFTTNNYHYVPAYILGKLYTNSLLATLNSRKPTKEDPSSSLSALPQSFGIPLQVTRVTERTGDGGTTLNEEWSGSLKDTLSKDADRAYTSTMSAREMV